MDIKTRKQLEKELQKRIKKVMSKQVKNMTKSTMQNHVIEDVYNAYIPESYVRTGQLLKDIDTKMVDNNTLSIESVRRDGEKDVGEIVETGKGYSTPELDAKIGARPFTERTKDELASGKFKQTLKDGLQSEGLNIK
ncbi:hypothetical protein ACDN41_12720 [Priestia aryabhattai]|uniref:hypothetical protein n=1 Tax=Priestia aryabhattai TaxID=412384 RepID=UPI0035321EE3